jgi:integrase
MMKLWDGKERQKAIGTADDEGPADGRLTLSFHHALARAEEWFVGNLEDSAPDRREYEHTELFKEIQPPPPYTVGNAARDYINWFRVHRKSLSRTYYVVKNQVVAPLGHIPLTELNPPTLQRWFDGLVETPPILATSRITGPKFAVRATDPESIRKRKNTANNILTCLKAVLNRAYEHGYIESDWAWAHVKRFKNVRQAAKVGYLEKKQIRDLVGAARPDAARMLKGGLMTGCRVGDLINMKVEDYLRPLRRIALVALKTDNLYHIALSKEGIELFDKFTESRRRDEPMFLTETGEPWTHYRFRVQFLIAQEKVGISPRVTFHMLRHTYASYAAMAGLPLKAIANQLGHTTTQMVDRYYAHLSEDFLDEAVREKMPRLLSD